MDNYTSFVCALCQKEKLKHLDVSGLNKLVENSSRIAQHQNKLSTHFSEIADIIRKPINTLHKRGPSILVQATLRKLLRRSSGQI
jgi:predicted ATP-dependent protease